MVATTTIQLKRRVTGAAGAPTSLKSGELAINMVDSIGYAGFGDDGSGNATSILSFAGAGAFLLKSLLNAANGVAGLDGSGKLPLSIIPASLTGAMNYVGLWNASTNSPALASGAGTKGQYYKVSVAGTTALDGNSNWNVGDIAVFDATAWDKIDGPAEAVVSVAGRIGAITLTSADLTDTTVAGKSLLTALSVAAQRQLLGIDSRRAVADANYSVVAGDYNVQFTSITAARTVTLMAASAYSPGAKVRVGDSSGAASSSNAVTVAVVGADTINGSTTVLVAAPYGQIEIMSDGTSKWTLLGTPATVSSTSADGGSF